MNRLRYYKRIFSAYIFCRKNSNLTFWHTNLKINAPEKINRLAYYYLDYTVKADYPGPFDTNGVPMLNYFGDVGIQYNPDAIAQYALGNYEKYLTNNDSQYKEIFLKQADWFKNNLHERANGIGVWEYNFDFEYFKPFKKPWHTSLAQGHGISVLVRAYLLTKESAYLAAADKAFLAFMYPTITDGGVKYIDQSKNVWFEEAIIDPPTHILNGFIWALWGINDYWLATQKPKARDCFNQGVITLEKNLALYDCGFWSCYDLAPTKIPNVASWYYHQLHIAQLQIMYYLTGNRFFSQFADKWRKYQASKLRRWSALGLKSIFKILYY